MADSRIDPVWRDNLGWHETRSRAMVEDPHEGWANYKRSTVVVPTTLLTPEHTVNLLVTRDADTGFINTFCEWIDMHGDPVRVQLAGQVTQRIESLKKSLQKENRSRVGRMIRRTGQKLRSDNDNEPDAKERLEARYQGIFAHNSKS